MAIIFKRLCVKELTGIRGGALEEPTLLDLYEAPPDPVDLPVFNRSAACLIGELGTLAMNSGCKG